MQGSSRTALAESRQSLNTNLSQAASPVALGQELFAVADVLASNGSLRRAAGDAARPTEAKQALVSQIFGGKVSAPALAVLNQVVAGRWAHERDAVVALDELGAESIAAGAEQTGELEQVETDLFQFGRIVAGDSALREALTDRRRTAQDRAGLAATLTQGKTTEAGAALIARAAQGPNGLRFDRVLDRFAEIAADRRQQLTAVVTAASALTPEQTQRLGAALQKMYGQLVGLNVVVDPAVVGGLHVQIGDDVIDGTLARRLDDAKRALVG